MEVYYILNHLFALLLAVWGLIYLIPLVFPDILDHPTRYSLGAGVFLLIIALTLGTSNYQKADRSGHLIAHYYLEDVINTVPSDRPVILITAGDDIFMFWYTQYGRGELENVILIGSDTFFAQKSWYWEWIRKRNPGLALPDTAGIINDAKGDTELRDRLFIAELFQKNKDNYDILFTKFTQSINPEVLDQGIIPYQRGVLMQLVPFDQHGEGLFLEQELFEAYNIGPILQLDADAFDFYEEELFSRYALPLYNYGRFFASKGDMVKSLEFFSLAERFMVEPPGSEFYDQVKNEIGLAYLSVAKSEKDTERRDTLFSKAKDIFIGLSKSNPGKAIYHAHLANLYFREENIEMARKEAYEALRLDPANQFLMRLIDRIEGREVDDEEIFTYL